VSRIVATKQCTAAQLKQLLQEAAALQLDLQRESDQLSEVSTSQYFKCPFIHINVYMQLLARVESLDQVVAQELQGFTQGIAMLADHYGETTASLDGLQSLGFPFLQNILATVPPGADSDAEFPEPDRSLVDLCVIGGRPLPGNSEGSPAPVPVLQSREKQMWRTLLDLQQALYAQAAQCEALGVQSRHALHVALTAAVLQWTTHVRKLLLTGSREDCGGEQFVPWGSASRCAS
jgi:hypothetical protein